MTATNKRWRRKFAAAFSGIACSVRTQNSLWVHIAVSVAVIGLSLWLDLGGWQWAAILFAIAMVISAELVNTSIEHLVGVLHPEHDERIGRALDAAAGAVLVTAVGAVTIGLIVLGPPMWEWLSPIGI